MRKSIVLFLILSACSSVPKQPDVTDQTCSKIQKEILKPGARGNWAPGLYVVDLGEGRPPSLWCSRTPIMFVPKDIFKPVK